MSITDKQRKDIMSMKRRSGIISTAIFSAALLALAGCSAQKGNEEPAESVLADADAGSGAKPAAPDKKEEKKTRTGTFPVTCTNTSYDMTDGDYVTVNGTVYSFGLDDESALAYPELAKRIDGINEEAYSQFMSEMETASAQSIQRHMDGWEYPYEETAVAEAVRADDRAFSYNVAYYSYLGGAHGYTYFGSAVIDPVTGRDIAFSDVVTDASDFPQICLDELTGQDPDMKDYFDASGSDGENLLDRIREDIRDPEKEGPVWTLGYDGIDIYFEDYAMGSYAAGSKVVHIPYESHREIFDSTYFEFGGPVPDAKDHITVVNTDAKEPLKPENSFLKVGYDWDYRYEDTAPYSYGQADVFFIDDDHPALRKKVDSLNEEAKKRLDSGYAGFRKTADSEYEEYRKTSEGGYFGRCSYGLNRYLARADEKVFSYAEAEEWVGIKKNSRTVVGVNIDTGTGQDLALDDIVTDIYDLVDAIDEALKEEGYPDNIEKMTSDEIHKQINSKNFISNDKLSWTIGYEGLNIYCNNTVNFSLADFGQDAVPIFVPFAGHEDLFAEGLTDVPVSYAYQIPVSGIFGTSVKLDTQHSGKYDDINIYPSMNEYGEVDHLTFGLNGFLNNVENFYASDLLMTVVKDPMGDFYIYAQCPVDDGGVLMRVFGLSYGNLYDVTEDEYLPQKVVYAATGAGNEKGSVMTDPLSFSVYENDYALGYRAAYSECCISSLGFPKPKDGKWYYPKDTVFDIRAIKDISTDKGVIAAGEILSPYSMSEPDTDHWEDPKEGGIYILTLKSKTGKQYEMKLERKSYEWMFNGTEVKELFDGFFNYPG